MGDVVEQIRGEAQCLEIRRHDRPQPGQQGIQVGEAGVGVIGPSTSVDAGIESREAALAEWKSVRGAVLDALRRRMRIREIGEFSRRLDVLAASIGDRALIEDARRLHLAVQRFDAHQMKRVLDQLAGTPVQEKTDDAQ